MYQVISCVACRGGKFRSPAVIIHFSIHYVLSYLPVSGRLRIVSVKSVWFLLLCLVIWYLVLCLVCVIFSVSCVFVWSLCLLSNHFNLCVFNKRHTRQRDATQTSSNDLRIFSDAGTSFSVYKVFKGFTKHLKSLSTKTTPTNNPLKGLRSFNHSAS